MTPEAQRIAIAEACPDIFRQVDDSGNVVANGLWWEYLDGLFWRQCLNNDPLSDLNAMREAEKVLTPEQRIRFIHALGLDVLMICPLAGECWMAQELDSWTMAHATAAQRAEAFLRTIRKWTDQ